MRRHQVPGSLGGGQEWHPGPKGWWLHGICEQGGRPPRNPSMLTPGLRLPNSRRVRHNCPLSKPPHRRHFVVRARADRYRCLKVFSLARQTSDVPRQTSRAVPRCGPTNSSRSASPKPSLFPLDSARPSAPLAASAPARFWKVPPGSDPGQGTAHTAQGPGSENSRSAYVVHFRGSLWHEAASVLVPPSRSRQQSRETERDSR